MLWNFTVPLVLEEEPFNSTVMSLEIEASEMVDLARVPDITGAYALR